MRICVAQTMSVKGDIAANIAAHQQLIGEAVAQGADTIIFPELSLTGYEPELARQLALRPDDERLAVFQQLSDTHGVVILVGAPTPAADGTRISLLIFQPHQPLQLYSKQQLHADELPYFVAGGEQVLLTIGDVRLAPAICYESLQSNHAAHAHRLGATVYLTSVAKSQAGVEKAQRHFPEVARRYAMPVVMANCVGYCDNFTSAGQSAIWNSQGELVAQLGTTDEGLLVFDTDA